MIEYTLAFIFLPGDRVIMLEKKDSYHAGRLNGVGGKIEDGEKIHKCIQREVKEEVGIYLEEESYKHFARLMWPGITVEVFWAKINDDENFDIKLVSDVGEKVNFIWHESVGFPSNTFVGHAGWLILAALDDMRAEKEDESLFIIADYRGGDKK